MNRVAIIGSGGAVKSTLARQLGAVLELPVLCLDREFWQPGWVMTPLEARSRLQAEMVAGERWIIDGNYASTMAARLEASDTIIFLDVHPWRCMWRVISRSLRFHGQSRPDMGPGCREQLPDREFLAWIATYRRRQRPQVKRLLERLPAATDLHVLHTPRQVRRFLDQTRLRTAVGKAALKAAWNEAQRSI